MAWLAVSLVVALLLIVPFVALHRETEALDDAARKARGGSYVKLRDGITHYELQGPLDGPVVVLVHGGTIPFYAWDAQVPALVEAGHRVLRYTQFGRGYSDRPDTTYDRALYQRQLRELLEALRIDGPIRLVGVSFGAATAATFARDNPERVDKLVLIAPVVDYTQGRALFGVARVPLLGRWFVRVFAVRSAVERATGFFQDAEAPAIYSTRFDAQTRFEGFERALLSFARSDALRSYAETYAALGDRPKLLIWGAEDSEIPREHIDFLRETLANLTYAEISKAGHGVTVERAEQVNIHLTVFLGTGSASKNPTIPTT